MTIQEGSRIKVIAFKVPDLFGRMCITQYAGRIGTVHAIGDPDLGSLAVKVAFDDDSEYYYWFPMCFLAEITERPTKKRKRPSDNE